MIVFKYDNAGIPKTTLYSTAKRLIPEIKKIANATYDDPRASAHLPEDEDALNVIQAAIKLKQKLKPELLIVAGIGGSNLGTIAVHEAINGKNHNLTSAPEIHFADTIDPDKLAAIRERMQHYLRQGKKVLLNVVTKSGTTTETIANFEFLLNVLKRHRKDADKYVMVTTDRDSKLWQLAITKGWSLLEIPKNVGGRYSVFTAVGLFPLGMLGINIKQLLAGARDMRAKCINENIKQNPAALGASLIYLHSKKRAIYDHFLYSTDLESLGKWYRQLMGESIGKEHSTRGKKVNKGITPTVSIGSTDLHSMAQLYLGGPHDKFTNFVTTHFNTNLKVPTYPAFDQLVPDLQGKEYHTLMTAILDGVKIAYKKGKRPYTETRLDGKTEETIGAFMQLKMTEMMLLGRLLNVNPFDQPNVEQYKKETRRILARG